MHCGFRGEVCDFLVASFFSPMKYFADGRLMAFRFCVVFVTMYSVGGLLMVWHLCVSSETKYSAVVGYRAL